MTKRKRSLPTELPADPVAAIKRFAEYPRPKRYRLAPPASEADIRACEEKLGRALPPELRSVLLVHDGLLDIEYTKFAGFEDGDLLGGTTTLSKLHFAFLDEWNYFVPQFEYELPFHFYQDHLVIGCNSGIGNDYFIFDTAFMVDGMHPVVRFDLNKGYELTGFRSLTHYLHWAFIHKNEPEWVEPAEMFPECYSAVKFRNMMRKAVLARFN